MTDSDASSSEPTGVIVGVDGSKGAAEALRWARREAELRRLPLTAVLAWDYLDQHHSDGRRDFDPHYSDADAQQALTAAVADALGSEAADVRQLAICDKPPSALLHAGRSADLIVVGARGVGGFKGLLLGSTSQHVLHHARVPVAVIRQDSAARFSAAGRVAAGLDGSPGSLHALQWAIGEARVREAALRVVHAWHMPYAAVTPFVGDAYDATLYDRAANETVDHALAQAQPPAELPIDLVVTEGSAAEALIAAGRDADVIVVGARGLGGFTGLILGSVSQHVTRHATCPVIVVPLAETVR